MNIAKFSIKRPVVTMMIIISMTIIGFLVLTNLKTQLFPNFNMPTARIRADWRGASPEDMENLVTKEIETGLTKVEGIRRVTTRSSMGSSSLTVEFEYGVKIDDKVNELVTAVNRIRNQLPEEIKEPTVSKSSGMADRVIMIGINGSDLVTLKIFADNIVVPRLERIEGVGEISISGGDEREVSVSIDPDKLETYGLNISDLYSTLKKASLNFPAGYVREGDKEYLVRVFGEIKTLEDVQEIVIKNSNGETLYLSDVADIRLGSKDRSSYGRADGVENIILTISKTDVGNAVEISEQVQKELKALESLLPQGSRFTITRDTAKDINNSIDAVRNNALTGLLLAVIILYFFLKDIRATFIVAIAIPVSIISTFGFFGFKDISLNMISLMGLSLGVGMLVDNSVVVLDNIFRHLTELGQDRMEASENGATEVLVPIIASTATTVAVFVPIVLREGRAKEMYQDMCYSIAFSLLASLIVAVTFVPMMSSRLLKDKKTVHEDGRVLNFCKEKYTKLLTGALKHRFVTLAGVVALFVGVVIYGGKFIGSEFQPQTDDGVYTVIAELPSGMDVEKANRVSRIMESAVMENKSTKSYTTSVSKNAVSVVVDVGYKSQREDKRPIFEIMGETRKYVGAIPDVKLNYTPRMAYGRGAGKNFSVMFRSDNMNQVDYITRTLIEKMEKDPMFVDVSSSIINGNPEARLVLDRKKLEYYGINVNDMSMAISYQILGGTPIKLKTLNEELDLTLQLDKKYRQSLDLLMDARVKSKDGKSLKLRDIAELVIAEGPAAIEKEDKIGLVTVEANLTGAVNLKAAQSSVSEMIYEIGLPQNIGVEFGGDSRSMKEVNEHLNFALLVSLFLVYFILAAQFESYILPGIVMITVPLAVTGVYAGLLITNQKNNPMVFVGIIMLAGIVVNNAIVLIDYIKILIEERDYSMWDGLIEAGRTRLRPILMTTLTTVFGMIPLALGIGQGSERYKGMAIAVIFGLTFSTLLTLVVIPVMFEVYYESRKKLEAKFYKN
ncbi:MAG: efflux RND transporter permease subunit [Fusobacteriaceae bacterium]